MSKVSIVIPTYNREKTIVRTLQSAIKQNFDNFEIIVIDNCSTDNTVNLVANYNQVRLIQNDRNEGPVLNWYKGILSARGDYVKLLFSDDEISTNNIRRSYEILHQNDDMGFVISSIFHTLNRDSTGLREEGEVTAVIKSSWVYYYRKIFGFGDLPNSPGAALFRRRDLLDVLTIYLPNRRNLTFSAHGAGVDLMIYLRLLSRYKKVGVVTGVHNVFHGHDESFTTTMNLKKYYDYAKLASSRERGSVWLTTLLSLYFRIKH